MNMATARRVLRTVGILLLGVAVAVLEDVGVCDGLCVTVLVAVTETAPLAFNGTPKGGLLASPVTAFVTG